MKVLWFTNIPLPQMLGTNTQSHERTGGWMVALLEQLSQVAGMEVSVACAAPGLTKIKSKSIKNLQFWPLYQGPARRPFAFNNPDNDPRYLDACLEVIRTVQPDIIHVHGTERFYGLIGARNLSSIPVLISLQGILREITRFQHYFGVTKLLDILAMHDLFHLARGIGPLPRFFQMRRSAKRELEIMRGNCWFMGRTLWDRAHLLAVNPAARYFRVPELLRPTFYRNKWDITESQQYRIIFTNADSPSRGVETLIDAVAILKRDFPAVCLALAGGCEQLPYGKRIRRRIVRLGLQETVEILGRLNEQQMADELRKAHVFVIASLVENSPNSLCEAQLVGLPCVASYAGGIPSLVEEGQTGLLFPAGDAPVLAERIYEIFTNDSLACALGVQARKTALVRHDPETITRTVVETYAAVIREAKETVAC